MKTLRLYLKDNKSKMQKIIKNLIEIALKIWI